MYTFICCRLKRKQNINHKMLDERNKWREMYIKLYHEYLELLKQKQIIDLS